MENNSISDVEEIDFSPSEIKNHPPVSEIRCFLYNSIYPSDMANHYLILNEVCYSELHDSHFFDIVKNNPNVILYPTSFDVDWIKNFVDTTMNPQTKDLSLSLLKSIYFYFFDVIASQKYESLNDNLDLFLNLTLNPTNPITEILHCRIISMILLLKLKIKFDPNEIHNISEFDTRNLHMILKNHQEGLSEYSSLSLINFAIIYCIPSAIIDDEITKYDEKKETPDFIQITPEPEFIFYHHDYFTDDIFDFGIFLFQSIYGYIQKEINSFNEENMNDYDHGIIQNDPNKKIIINNPQFKIKTLLNLFLSDSIVTGTFLRIILMFDKNQEPKNKVIKKISKILFQCPKIRLSALLRCQHLLSFYELYSEYNDTIFSPNGGDFFANIPDELKEFSLYSAMSPYWSPQDSIIKVFDSDNPSLLIPHAIAMINRCRLEQPSFISEISEISAIQISGTLSQIFDRLVLCDNFSSKQTEEILFMGISGFFQMSRKNSDIIHRNHFLHRISVVATFKSLQFIFKAPQFNIVNEYGLSQKHAYKVICNFISENIDLFKGYISTYNNINNFYQRATVIQALNPRFKSVMLYFQIFLRATSYKQFWIALKFLRSLKYNEEDVDNLENIVFELKDSTLTKNAILFITELILRKEGFGELFVQSENFRSFTSQIVKSFEHAEYGEASLFLLCALYTKNLINREHKIKIDNIQYFYDNILELHEELYKTLLDLSVMICMCDKLKRFPFKIKHQKQAFYNRPDSISKNNFLVFLFINYPEVASRISKPPGNTLMFQNKKIFSFMNIINRPYHYLITPILFEGIEIKKIEEDFELIRNKGKNISTSNDKKEAGND